MNYPSLLRRFAAIGYDTLILLAISILYGFIVVAINFAINGAPAVGERVSWGGLEPVIFAGWIFTQIFYYVYFWNRIGQTVGMKTWRVQTLYNGSHTLSYKVGFIRAGLAILSFAAFGLGYLYALVDPDKQTLHDKLSGSITLLTPKLSK